MCRGINDHGQHPHETPQIRWKAHRLANTCVQFDRSTNRLFVEAVLWIVRTGSPWRDLPEHFGKWNTVFKRFRDWVKADVFVRLFEAVSGEPDMEYAMVDATIVRVHRHGQGAKGGLRARP